MIKEVDLFSVISCPLCGARKKEVMSENSCLIFYECTGCGSILRPEKDDCCVFCSYGDIPCPPVQKSGKCC
ncbi:MAG: GDCCVxC domain-containing (seleno)protein [Ignavibacteria bacterium]